MSGDMLCGLDYLGAEDAAKNGDSGFVSFLKKEGPALLADVAEGVKSATSGDKTKKVPDATKGTGMLSTSGGIMSNKPLVIGIGVALAAALGFGVYKIVH